MVERELKFVALVTHSGSCRTTSHIFKYAINESFFYVITSLAYCVELV